MSNFEYDLNEIQETLSSQLLSGRALIPFPFHVEEESQRDVNCMSAMMMMMMITMMMMMMMMMMIIMMLTTTMLAPGHPVAPGPADRHR